MKYFTIAKKLLALMILLNIFGTNALTALASSTTLMSAIGEAGLDTIGTDTYGYTDPRAPKSLPNIISDAILVALGMIGSIFLALIFYAGFRWLTSAGNDEIIKKNKGILVNSIIGLVIILASYAITMFIIQASLFATQADYSETFQYQ